MTTRSEQLKPEVRARTILAGCAHARLTPCGDVPSDVACDGHLGVLFDQTGSAYLVVAPDGRAPSGRFRITCRARVPGLGVLRLEGRCGQAICPASLPAVADVLERHQSTWAASDEGAETPASAEDLTVVSFDLDAVTVLTPATRTDRAGVVPVDLDAFEAACPDGWLLEAETLRERLEREHQADLLSLARRHAEPDLAAPLAVSVREVGPSRLDLACLSLDGVTPLAIHFEAALDHPDQVSLWVNRAAGSPEPSR